ncbi:hypothetical protein [Brevundimonas phage AA]|uniref:Uncharacterized protein n=1 Tax=Brevundimonas phage AA TaxID=2880937 RepID=A0AAN0KE77_9CAUD|nr:hypothetical protein [Brevundimonas phage BC]UCR90855.1 hypothetical protein [Brevundimonas phage AA]
MITQKDLFARVQALGLVIRKDWGGAGYRIARALDHYKALYPRKPRSYWHERQEVEAYYCDDRDDAYATAIHMAKPA